jgi:hypothetical protein
MLQLAMATFLFPRQLAEGVQVGPGHHVVAFGALPHAPDRTAGEPCAVSDDVIEAFHRHLLDLGTAVDIDELGQQKLDALCFQPGTDILAFLVIGYGVFIHGNDLIHGLIPFSNGVKVVPWFKWMLPKKTVQFSGQGLQRRRSGAYMGYVSIFRRCVTQPWALRRFLASKSLPV